jgi:hypothetical protein
LGKIFLQLNLIISAETACWDIERNKPNFLQGLLFAALYLPLWYTPLDTEDANETEIGKNNIFLRFF